MLGVPVSDQTTVREWSTDLARSLDAIGLMADSEVQERGVQARRALGEYFRALIPERCRQPRPDLLSALIAAEDAGNRLTERELLAMCILLFVAGHETR
jgi:cytochrome P450